MKKLLLPLLFICSLSYGQKEPLILPIDSITNKITYSEVVKVDSVSKQELFSRAREWFAKAYKNSSKVIQMEDKESGKIVGKALMQVYHKALGMTFESGYINYTISIYIKDGKYKYEFVDFYHTGQYVGNGNRIPDYGICENMIHTKDKNMGISYQKTYNYYLLQMDRNITVLVEDLKLSMLSKSKNNNDNW